MKSALANLLARHPEIVATNTPLDVLADHMIASLQLFEQSLLDRSDHDFYHPGRFNEESIGPTAVPVPRFIHVGNDEPIYGVSCPSCEE